MACIEIFCELKLPPKFANKNWGACYKTSIYMKFIIVKCYVFGIKILKNEWKKRFWPFIVLKLKINPSFSLLKRGDTQIAPFIPNCCNRK